MFGIHKYNDIISSLLAPNAERNQPVRLWRRRAKRKACPQRLASLGGTLRFFFVDNPEIDL